MGYGNVKKMEDMTWVVTQNDFEQTEVTLEWLYKDQVWSLSPPCSMQTPVGMHAPREPGDPECAGVCVH